MVGEGSTTDLKCGIMNYNYKIISYRICCKEQLCKEIKECITDSCRAYPMIHGKVSAKPLNPFGLKFLK